ncbi:MAG: hypothetical protein FWC00_06440, partial [Firmicutes bacterium]|nr:hypothetical protein [Bacillota bacterium]
AVIIMQSMSKEQMYPFKAWRTSLIAAVRLLFPITLGLVLDFGNLFIATTIIAVICIVMLATSFMIKSEFTPQKFGLFMGKYLKTAREHNYLKPIIHNFFVMMLKGMGEFVVIGVTLLIVLVLGTNVGIGAFGTVFAASSILLIIVYARIKKTAHKKFILLASGVLLLSVSFVFIIEISLLTLIIFNSVYMTVKRAVYAEYQTEKAKLPQYWARGKEFVIETKILQSIGLFIGRVIAFISIILVGLFGTTYVAFAWVIFGMMLALVAHTFLLYAFKKKYGCGYGTNVQSEAVTHLESGVT